MKHIRPVSQVRQPACADTSALESLVVLVMTVYFRDWDNYASVIQNLQKLYEKT